MAACCGFRLAGKSQTKPCWFLGGFSGEAGGITIATGEEALASESPVGKESSQRGGNGAHEAVVISLPATVRCR